MKKKIDRTVIIMAVFYTLLAGLVLAVLLTTTRPSRRHAKVSTTAMDSQPLAVDLWECADKPAPEYPNVLETQPRISCMAIEELEIEVAREVEAGARKVGAL